MSRSAGDDSVREGVGGEEPMGILDGKVALITGAGRGFGLAIAERFAAEGADLALNYRASRDACDTLAQQVNASGRRAVVIQADISDGAAVEAMVAQAMETFG